MPIRKGKIHRLCKCGKMFEPTGQYCRMCKRCNPVKTPVWLMKAKRRVKE